MLCNPVSYYPNKIDAMTFFQDNNLEKMEIINHYNAFIAQGNYSEASDYISQQEGVYGFFADFYNLIENRIYTLQEYLFNKPPKKQPFIYYDEEERFSISDILVFADIEQKEDFLTSDIHIFTDTEEEEDISFIKLFSENEETEENGASISDVHIFANYFEEQEEALSSITLFSDHDEPETIDNLYIFMEEETAPPDADTDTIWI